MKDIKFGTGGFRGVIGDDFVKENIQLVAQGLADIIIERKEEDHPIVIGFDNRFLSDFAARWVAEVLSANGLKSLVINKAVPTPVVMSATRDMHNKYGVMITASHNPYYFNGIKLFTSEGYDADVNFTNALEKKIQDVREIKTINIHEARKKGLVEDYDNTSLYLSHIKSFIGSDVLNNKLKVLYNNMNGVGYIGLEPLSKLLNINRFTVMNSRHDAFFGFNLPNPTKEALAGEFAETVVNQGYDLGIATDSDGDRLGVIDEKGNYVSANEILASIYYYLVKYRGYEGDIVKNCATSLLVDQIATNLGYKCHEVDVGFKNITAAMKKHNALIGGESSGGLTMRGYIYGKDACFSASLFMEMCVILNKPVSEIIKEVKDFAHYDMHCIEDHIDLKADAAKVIEYIDKNHPCLSVSYDQVEHYTRNFKFHFSNGGWLLIRLSGTEPAFRVFSEFKDEKEGIRLIKELKDYIDALQESLI